MNICTAADEYYVSYLYVMLYSLFENNGDAEIYVYLLNDALGEIAIGVIRRLCEGYPYADPR